MSKKIGQKIYLSEVEKKHLEALAKREGVSQSELVGKLVLQAAGAKKYGGNGKLEAAIDYLLSTVEQAHINSVYNRIVLTQLAAGLPPEAKAKVLEKWKEKREELNIG